MEDEENLSKSAQKILKRRNDKANKGMIVPMSKYSFLIYHKDREPFMNKLMDIGVVHIIAKGVDVDDSAKKQSAEIALAEQVLDTFEKRNKSKNKIFRKTRIIPGQQWKIFPNSKKLEGRIKDRSALQIQIKLMEPWGEFSWEGVKNLEKETGVALRFCRHPKRKFKKEWYDDHPIEIVNQEKGFLYFILFQEDENSRLTSCSARTSQEIFV